MDEIKPNSNKYRQKQQLQSGVKRESRLSKVANGEIKKESEFSKLLHRFIATDSKTLKDYILNDVFIPFVKKGIMDTVGMILYNSPTAGKNRGGTGISNITYGGNINAGYQGKPIQQIQKRDHGFNYDKIRFNDRKDAESILNALQGAIIQYGAVSVYELYDAAGISTDNYTMYDYGWNDLTGSDILRGSDGYYLKLPNAVPLK